MLYKVFLTLKSVYQNFFFLIFIFILFYILYLHKYLPYTYFLHNAYTTLTCTTYKHILQYNYTSQIELQLIYLRYCLHVNCSSH